MIQYNYFIGGLDRVRGYESSRFFGPNYWLTNFEYRIPFMVGKVADSSLNKDKGLKQGDVIASINGKTLKYYDQLDEVRGDLKNTSVTAEILHEDNTKSTMQLQLDKDGKFGIRPFNNPKRFEELGYYDIFRKEYSFGESFGAGWRKFTKTISNYGDQLMAIFNPSTGAYKGLGGFKAIYDQFSPVWSWPYFWGLTAFLSIISCLKLRVILPFSLFGFNEYEPKKVRRF